MPPFGSHCGPTDYDFLTPPGNKGIIEENIYLHEAAPDISFTLNYLSNGFAPHF